MNKYSRFCLCALMGLLLLPTQAEARPKLRLSFGPSLFKLKNDCDTRKRSASCAKAGVQLEKQGKRAEAAGYYKKACEAKTKPRGSACFLWGLLRKDKRTNNAVYARGCKLKDADSCTAAGELAAKKGKTADAMAFYRKGCKGNDGRGCHRVARYLVKGRKIAEGQQLLRRSCALGYSPGCGYLGWIYETMQKKLQKAKKAYNVGCNQKGATECARLGLLLFKLKQPKLALRSLRRACKLGYRRSCKLARKLNMQMNGPPKRR